MLLPPCTYLTIVHSPLCGGTDECVTNGGDRRQGREAQTQFSQMRAIRGELARLEEIKRAVWDDGESLVATQLERDARVVGMCPAIALPQAAGARRHSPR